MCPVCPTIKIGIVLVLCSPFRLKDNLCWSPDGNRAEYSQPSQADHSLSTFDIYTDAHLTTREQKIQAMVAGGNLHYISDVMPTLMFATKYSSMFSWNSGDMKVSSALDLISGSVMRKGSIWGTWGIRPFSSVSDMVRNRVQGQTLERSGLLFSIWEVLIKSWCVM